MNSWRRVILIAGLALAAPVAARAGQACAYQDFMPAYQAFRESLPGEATAGQRADAFVARFAPTAAGYYTPALFGDAGRLRARAERAFAQATPDSAARTQALAARITARFDAVQGRFLRTFPDFDCQATVLFGPSLGVFDGNVAGQPGGPRTLRFGVDVIASLHSAVDLEAFLDHELFHVYHAGLHPRVGEGAPLYWNLWMEGLASYVSHEMNPDLGLGDIFWSPRDLADQLSPRRAELARAIAPRLAATDEAVQADYLTSTRHAAGLPPRSGYYFGYLFAERLARDHSLAALARMTPDEVEAKMRAFAADLAGPAR